MGNTQSKWNKETVIAAFHKWTKHYGKQPSANEWNNQVKSRASDSHLQNNIYPYPSGVRALFGSWNNLVVAAGYPTQSNGVIRGPYKPSEQREREREKRDALILELVRHGHTDADAALAAGVSKDTVRHVRMTNGIRTRNLSIDKVVSDMLANR